MQNFSKMKPGKVTIAQLLDNEKKALKSSSSVLRDALSELRSN
jgi:hypothetical protein